VARRELVEQRRDRLELALVAGGDLAPKLSSPRTIRS
jgi:hypothetical protein